MSKIFKKVFSVALCAALVGGTAVALPGVVQESGIVASAGGSETVVIEDFEVALYEGDTLVIVKYLGSDTEVVIPSYLHNMKIKKIDYYAFRDCNTVTSVTIPEGITSINSDAFFGCTGLTIINVSSNNPAYSSEDGVLFNKDKSTLICCPARKSGSYTIPNKVTDIEYRAFYKCSGLTGITIPNSVTKIEYNQFYGCTGLTSITIPDSITSIGDCAFDGCTGLTNITFSDGVTNINSNAFYGCTGITSITVPDSVINISNSAFLDTVWYKSQSDGVVYAGKVVYAYKGDMPSDTSIVLKAGTKGISDYAFYNYTELTNITIPDSVVSIGREAFYNTTWYESQPDGYVYAGKVIYSYKGDMLPDTNIVLKAGTKGIADYMLSGCTGLSSITIPDSVTNIGNWAFTDCTGLTDIIIPDSVMCIGSYAFNACTGLSSITIPDSVTNIGNRAFRDCENLSIYGIKGSYAETYAKENNIPFVVMPLKNNSTVTTTATVGEPITLNAIAEGGTVPYTYALMYKKSTSSTWNKIGTKYGTKSTGSFTPGKAVKYDIMINVKDATGKIKSKTFTVDVKAPLKNKTTINAETVKVGEKIVLKGAASGGTAGYKYAFYYKKSKNSDWLELITPYTTKSIAFKPKSATSYDLKSVVKDADGRTTEKTFTVKVTK